MIKLNKLQKIFAINKKQDLTIGVKSLTYLIVLSVDYEKGKSNITNGDTMIKVFRDSESSNKFFYHFNLFGLKFRIATNTRGFNKYGTYKTNRGRVVNFGRKYMCFIPMF